MSKRILFIGPHRPNRSPSQRFRMEQFFPYLEEKGFECDYSWFINEKDDQIFYSTGHWFKKFGVLMKAIRVRLTDVMRRNKYDVIFIQREAFMTGSVFFEKQFRKSKAKLIYDFDDAIWLEDISHHNRLFKWLKRPQKTNDLITMADDVIAGNSFLADYARKFNSSVSIIPTTVDTNRFKPAEYKKQDYPVVIGWTGTQTTLQHFQLAVPALKKLKEQWGDKIEIRLISDRKLEVVDFPLICKEWKLQSEVKDLQEFNIGIMPLPDDEWSKGKCGFKAIQYMALEIPPVVSPVGMNKEIIKNGVNGFLANTEKEWVQSLTKLIQFHVLREELGKAARDSIEEQYSVKSQMDHLISIMKA
jgi:glycosyltransferase involved in cell wall biosynthesis